MWSPRSKPDGHTDESAVIRGARERRNGSSSRLASIACDPIVHTVCVGEDKSYTGADVESLKPARRIRPIPVFVAGDAGHALVRHALAPRVQYEVRRRIGNCKRGQQAADDPAFDPITVLK